MEDFFSYKEVAIVILDKQVRKLRSQEMTLVKVFLRNQKVEEATWGSKGDKCSRYIFLLKSLDEVLVGINLNPTLNS